jgi:hypothetical protein
MNNAFKRIGNGCGGKMSLVAMSAVAYIIMSLLSSTALGQTSTGSIVGQVKDTREAVIPGAIVTVTRADNNQSVVVRSNSSGLYAVSALSGGSYIVEVAKSGFENVKVTGVVVNIAATSTVNAVMNV